MSLGSNDDWLSAGGVSKSTKHVNPTGNQAIRQDSDGGCVGRHGNRIFLPDQRLDLRLRDRYRHTDNFFALNAARRSRTRRGSRSMPMRGINIAARPDSQSRVHQSHHHRDATPDTEQIRLANTFFGGSPHRAGRGLPGNYVSDQPQTQWRRLVPAPTTGLFRPGRRQLRLAYHLARDRARARPEACP